MEDLVSQNEQPVVQDTQPAAEQIPEQHEVQPEAAAEQTIIVEEVPQEVPAETSDFAVPEAKGEPKWYIVQTLTGQEDRVKSRIETTVEELGLKERILRVLVPEEETVEIRGDKRVERKRKMYPGYVFVEMILDEDTWYKIRSTAGVARFIGGKTSPVPVTDREMQRVLKQLGIKEKEITVEFSVGEPVRIISGSFRGYTGSVYEINAAKSKLKAMINIFGRDTSVEVDFDRVEKVI
ncbi:MAG: transcription termination/antitermination protein NusG [Candidatus Margulisiibacteriota bacterium]